MRDEPFSNSAFRLYDEHLRATVELASLKIELLLQCAVFVEELMQHGVVWF